MTVPNIHMTLMNIRFLKKLKCTKQVNPVQCWIKLFFTCIFNYVYFPCTCKVTNKTMFIGEFLNQTNTVLLKSKLVPPPVLFLARLISFLCRHFSFLLRNSEAFGMAYRKKPDMCKDHCSAVYKQVDGAGQHTL